MRTWQCNQKVAALELLGRALLVGLTAMIARADEAPPGWAEPVAVESYLNGVFPDEPAGQASSWTTARAFPNLQFTAPMWLVPWPGTNDLLLVERNGRLKRFPNDQDALPSDVSTVLDWRVRTQANADDGGMFSAVFHPRFADPVDPQRFLFICYTHRLVEGVTHPEGSSYWRLTRMACDQSGDIIPGSETVLISLFDPQKWHNGGAMFFGPEGFLYLSNGDGGTLTNAYDNGQHVDKSLFGVVIRIDVDQVGGDVSHPIRRQPQEVTPLPEGVDSSYTQNYHIPSDNPWVEEPSGGGEAPYLEEIYACGLRSPHSMHYDQPTGQVWIGDVGLNHREELDLFVIDPSRPVLPGEGLNFGWSLREGELGVPLPAEAPGGEVMPVLTYPRTEGQCIISGGVYRGSRFQLELGGKVLMADHRNARIWALDYREGEAPVLEQLAVLSEDGEALGGRAGGGLTNFCRDQDGEVYLLYSHYPWRPEGKIYTLAAGPPHPLPPLLLSETGAFTDLASLTPAPFLLPYNVNSPLWSDRALKKRWIALPNDGVHDEPGEQITYRDTGPWTFPAGTVLVKHFELPVDERDPSLTVPLETRFIVCLPEGRQYGVTYRWRPDGSDADLLMEGATGNYPVTRADGSSSPQTWQFPGPADCAACHHSVSGQALGVRTVQLAGECVYPGSRTPSDQLEAWNALGMFDVTLMPEQIDGVLRSASLGDRSAPLEHRVRSYLDSNCAHCHRPGGSGPGFDARLSQPLLSQNLINTPLQSHFVGRYDLIVGSDEDGQVIPGRTDLSAVHVRLAHAQPDPASMPPLAKNVVDEDAVQAMTNWIEGMAGQDFSESAPVRVQVGGPGGPVTGRFPVTVIFDRDVDDFAAGDVLVGNGVVSGVSGSGYYRVVQILPTGSPVTVEVTADAVEEAGNGSLSSGQLAIPFQIVLEAEHEPATGTVKLRWPSHGELRYTLRSSASPTGDPAGWPIVDGFESIAAAEPCHEVTVTVPPGSVRFFVVEAMLP